MFDLPCNHRVAHHPDAVCIRDHDRPIEETRVFDPGRARHFTVAVQSKPGRENCIIAGLAPRMDGRDTGPYGTFAHLQLALSGNERSVANLDSANVGDGIVRPWGTVEGNTQVASAWFAL